MRHHFSSGVYIKEQTLRAGEKATTHRHTFAHFWLLGHGSAAVEVDGAGRTYRGPCVIEIAAGKAHTITALTDITSFCIHATSVTDPEKIDMTLIEGGDHAVG